jgi:hypothetical protein
MEQTIYIELGTKKYPLVITPCLDKEDIKDWFIHVKCIEAELDQEYLEEDLHLLIKDLPWMIEHFQQKRKSWSITIRINPEDKIKIEKYAKQRWFQDISAYIRERALQPA